LLRLQNPLLRGDCAWELSRGCAVSGVQFHERLTQAEQLDPGHAVYVVAARADWSQPTSESEKFWEVALASVRGCRRPLSFCCPVWTPPPYPPKESRSRGEAVSVPIPFLVLLEALLCEEGGGKGGMWGRGTEG